MMRTRLIAASVFLAALLAPAMARPSPSEQASRVRMPLFVETRAFEDGIGALIPPHGGERLSAARPEYGRILLEARALESALGNEVSPETMREIRVRAVTERERAYIPLSALLASGLTAAYDDVAVELRIGVPPGLRRLGTHALSTKTPWGAGADAVGPAPWSAHVNASASQDFRWNAPNATAGRQPFHAELDGAANARGWVLEAGASRDNSSPAPWTRGDVRLVRDFPEGMIRATAGDLAYPVRGYQRFRPMGGVAVARNFSLQPYRLTVPTSRRELFLKRRSLVKAWVNGRYVRTLELDAGPHELTEFPVSNGLNDVELEIIDDTGRTERVSFRFSSELELLAPGLHQFAFAVGAPSAPLRGSRAYDRHAPTVSLSHRFGLSPARTLGAYAQGDDRQKLFGLEALQSTPFGAFGAEPALSHVNGSDPSFAGKLKYLVTDYRGPGGSPRSLALQAERRGLRFAQLGDLSPRNLSSLTLSAMYSQQVLRLFSAALSGDYSFARPRDDAPPDTYGYSLLASRGFGESWQASLTFSRRKIETGGFDTGFFFS